MALTLVVRSSRPEHARQITLDSPRIVLGRASGSDLCLPDPSVSHRHATLRQRGQDYIILDEGSTNGTFVGPVRLSPQASRVIRSGDLIRVGRIWLEVRSDPTPVTDNPALATRELVLGMVADALEAEGQATLPVITVIEGPDAGGSMELADNERRYVAGRSKAADLTITDADASRRHLEVFRRGAQVFVRDLASKNGTLLGAAKLPADREVVWNDALPVQIGLDKLSLSDPVALALAELSTAADEHLPPQEDVPVPGIVETTDSPSLQESSPPLPSRSATRRARQARARRYSVLDLFIAATAIAVVAASLLLLYWLFSGASVVG
jgi:pSer/pThr/pTyr-binding forkhead associated (FHA) protein